MNKQLRTLKVLNIFAFIAMVAVNIAAQTMPLGGFTTQEISAFYPTLLTPAGITFAIWSVIYLLTGWFVFQQAFSANDQMTEKTGWLFAVTCALNIAWIVSWHYQMMLFATVIIVALWVCLLQLYRRTDRQPWHLKTGFTIYYAWITVATAVQVFIYLALVIPAIHVQRTAVTITIAVLAALTILALRKIFSAHDYFFGLTVAWSIFGIFLSHLGEGYNKMYPLIVLVSGLCTLILVASLLIQVMQNERPTMLPDTPADPAEPLPEAGK